MPASMGVGAADQVIGQPELTFDVAQRTYDAGSEAQVALTITNRGKLTKGGDQKYEDRVTTARALVLSIDDSQIPLEADVGSVAVGNVPTGAVTSDPILRAPDHLRVRVHSVRQLRSGHRRVR
jgi:hypothetical protein